MYKRPENSIVGGFVRTDGGKASPQVESRRPDELATIENMADAEARLAQNAANIAAGGKGFPKGKSLTRQRKTKLAIMGIPKVALDTGDPRYAKAVRMASAYRKVRARELAIAHGYVSSGASSLLATAALALASSRFLYEIATQGDLETAPGMLKMASQLADSARQNELAAWELCAREAVARKKSMANSAGVPWMVPSDREGRAGRHRKEELSKEVINLPPIGSDLAPWLERAAENGTVENGHIASEKANASIGTKETEHVEYKGNGTDEAVQGVQGPGSGEPESSGSHSQAKRGNPRS